jgi:hypothetical protein
MSLVRMTFCISDSTDEEDNGGSKEGEDERIFPKKMKQL